MNIATPFASYALRGRPIQVADHILELLATHARDAEVEKLLKLARQLATLFAASVHSVSGSIERQLLSSIKVMKSGYDCCQAHRQFVSPTYSSFQIKI